MHDISYLKSNVLVSATYDTIFQVCLRIISFVLNCFIVRHISSSVFAVITVRLYLLYSTSLLLSREAFRRAVLGCKSPQHINRIVNLIWIGAGFSLPVSFTGWIIWEYVMESPDIPVSSDYHNGVLLVLASVIVEVCAESPHLMAELHMWPKVKVFIESLMQLLRATLLFLGIYLWPERAVLAYGISHLIGSVVYCASFYLIFYVEFRKKDRAKKLLFGSFRNLFVTFDEGTKLPKIDPELWLVSLSFLKQGWIKEALTEGELFLMNFLPLVSLSDQGVYQVVNNLGSLAARLIFRVLEGASYKFFAQSVTRGIKIKDQDEKKMKEVNDFFVSLLKNVMLLSFFILTFGWAYSHPLLHMYGGLRLSSSGCNILRMHCFYVVFLAINGITEAFSFAVMSDTDLARYNYRLVCFSVAYIGSTSIFAYIFGIFGFIIGNCFNMMLRINHSFFFIRKIFEGSNFQPLQPRYISKKIIVSFLVAFLFTSLSEIFVYPHSLVLHIATGGVMGCWVVFVLREELKGVIVFGFQQIDSIYVKLCSKTGKPFNFFILNILYNFLFIK